MNPHRAGLVSTRLHHFQLVARLGSIRQAAVALNVAPSSISRVIVALEAELKTPLFERVRQRLKLTSAGELLLYHARASLAELTRACQTIDDLQGQRHGTVRAAVVESAARGLLPDVLDAYWQRHAGITVDVKVMPSQDAFDAVAEGECDIAVAFDVRTPRNAQRLASATLSLGAIMAPQHGLASRKSLRLFDLAGERVLLSDTSLTLGVLVEEAMAASDIAVVGRAHTNSIGLMAELALRGTGIAMQTRMGVAREVAAGTLAFVPFDDPKLKPRKLLLISRAKSAMSNAASSLAGLLAEAIEALPTELLRLLPAAQLPDRILPAMHDLAGLRQSPLTRQVP